MNAPALARELRASAGFAHKRDIAAVMRAVGRDVAGGAAALARGVDVGDDCAALPEGAGWLLFAIEGIVPEFVRRMPWFAGYCSVMVNVSDVYAMGGRPVAVVDAIWSDGLGAAAEVLAGIAAACERYAVPLVGGHSNARSSGPGLAVSVLGRASRLLSSFRARPGDALLVAIDLRGRFEEPYVYWNASTDAPGERLRADLEVLPALAEAGWCEAAKDISMAGTVGTALMLLECSRVGARIDADAVPRPPGIETSEKLLRWLAAFPSYGFVLAVPPADVDRVLARFHARDIAAARVGDVTADTRIMLRHAGSEAQLWDVARESFILPREGDPSCRLPATA